MISFYYEQHIQSPNPIEGQPRTLSDKFTIKSRRTKAGERNRARKATLSTPEAFIRRSVITANTDVASSVFNPELHMLAKPVLARLFRLYDANVARQKLNIAAKEISEQIDFGIDYDASFVSKREIKGNRSLWLPILFANEETTEKITKHADAIGEIIGVSDGLGQCSGFVLGMFSSEASAEAAMGTVTSVGIETVTFGPLRTKG